MGKLNGKVAIVTGAYLVEGSNSIGGTTALLMSREGAKVVAADIVDEPAERLVAKIKSEGGEAVVCHVDLRKEDQIEAMVETAIREFGGLDILHNNAANLPGPDDGDVVKMDSSIWDKTMEVTVRGTMLTCKHAVPQMIKRGGGAIVNTSSGAGLTGDVHHTAYGVSKAAINMLTQYVATQYGKQGVRCNAICPGLMRTATAKAFITPEVQQLHLKHSLSQRLGLPEDIANMIIFLASDDAAYINGQIISVDGGIFAHSPFSFEEVQTGPIKLGND